MGTKEFFHRVSQRWFYSAIVTLVVSFLGAYSFSITSDFKHPIAMGVAFACCAITFHRLLFFAKGVKLP